MIKKIDLKCYHLPSPVLLFCQINNLCQQSTVKHLWYEYSEHTHQTFFYLPFIEKIERTVQIEASTVEIEERGVKLRLTVVDTPGYGDAINSQDWYVYMP